MLSTFMPITTLGGYERSSPATSPLQSRTLRIAKNCIVRLRKNYKRRTQENELRQLRERRLRGNGRRNHRLPGETTNPFTGLCRSFVCIQYIMGMVSLTKKSVRVYTCLSPPKSRALAATAHRKFRPLLCAFKLVGMDNATARESMAEKWECACPRLSHNIQIIYKSAQGRLEIVCSPL